MAFAPLYVLHRLFYRIIQFFHHWYVDGSRLFAHAFIGMLESVDQTIAFRVTALHFFEPLYKDYSIIGRILGVIFRSGRLALGAVVYLFLIGCSALIYVAWAAIPIAAIFYAVFR